MNGIPPHVLTPRDGLKVFNLDVSLVAVLEDNEFITWHFAVVLFPEHDVNHAPVARRVARVGHFLLEVAVKIPEGAYRLPSMRLLAFLELGLFHATWAVTWAAQTLVRRHMPWREAERGADVVSAAQAASGRTGHVLGGFHKANSSSLVIDHHFRAAEFLGKFFGWSIRIFGTQFGHLCRRPDAIVGLGAPADPQQLRFGGDGLERAAREVLHHLSLRNRGIQAVQFV